MIWNEALSDLERGLKVVFAIVDMVTIGGAVAATKLSEMELKEELKALGKTVAIEFAANTTVCGVSALGEAFDWPIPITIMLSLATGIAVSCKGNKLLFEGEGFSRELILDDVEVEKIGGMIEGGSQPVPVKNKNITGMDWYDYFRETYGKENVCWENCNPSEVATAWQGSYPYVGVDTYTNTTLYDGDIIWMGEPFPTGYSTTTEAIADLGNDAQKIFGGLQVKPYYEKGMPFAEYRSSLTPYKVHGELNVAEGFALNNPQFGAGGLAQRFDPNFDYNYANGFLERLEEQAIELTNTRVSLEDYFNMMDEIK